MLSRRIESMSSIGKSLVLAAGALAVGLAIGALWFGSRGAEDHEQGVAVEAVSFRGSVGEADRALVDLGGLSLSASCRDYGLNRGPHLMVAARTAEDDAAIASSFIQQREGLQDPYSFVVFDFDRSFGAYDPLGSSPRNTVGTLIYSRPDGGQVTVDYVADRNAARGECLFSGTATYAEAQAGSEGSSGPDQARLDVTEAYLGVSCHEPNSIACDRVCLYAWTEQTPDSLVARIAAHSFSLERAERGGPDGAAAGYEGCLRVDGLLHRGTLAVEAGRDEHWLGKRAVRVPIDFRAIYADQTARPEAVRTVRLGAGYG